MWRCVYQGPDLLAEYVNDKELSGEDSEVEEEEAEMVFGVVHLPNTLNSVLRYMLYGNTVCSKCI